VLNVDLMTINLKLIQNNMEKKAEFK